MKPQTGYCMSTYRGGANSPKCKMRPQTGYCCSPRRGQAGAEKLRWDKLPEAHDEAADWILLFTSWWTSSKNREASVYLRCAVGRSACSARRGYRLDTAVHLMGTKQERRRTAREAATKLGRCRATVGCKDKGHKHHYDERHANVRSLCLKF